MNNPSLSPENVSSLIDRLLAAKDPATVGLKKIIRKKKEDLDDFPLQKVKFEEFDNPAVKKGILTDDERRILELEKQLSEFDQRFKRQQSDSAAAVKEAFNRGKAEGIRIGTEKGNAEAAALYNKNIAGIQENITACLKKVEDSKREIFSHSDHVILDLCLEITRKIIASEISTRQDVILNVTKKALSYIAERERLVIRVAPDDFKVINEGRDFWEPVNEKIREIIIEPDKRVDRGGCIIESNNGSVDARLGIQMEEISELVEKMWAEQEKGRSG